MPISLYQQMPQEKDRNPCRKRPRELFCVVSLFDQACPKHIQKHQQNPTGSSQSNPGQSRLPSGKTFLRRPGTAGQTVNLPEQQTPLPCGANTKAWAASAATRWGGRLEGQSLILAPTPLLPCSNWVLWAKTRKKGTSNNCCQCRQEGKDMEIPACLGDTSLLLFMGWHEKKDSSVQGRCTLLIPPRSEGSTPTRSSSCSCCSWASLGNTTFYFQHIFSINSSVCVIQEVRQEDRNSPF